MLLALTGTPGTGKSTVAALLGGLGYPICDLNRLAQERGALKAYDERRETWAVDVNKLARALPPDRPLVLVGHFSHLLAVDLAIVLRCHPETLRERLEARGWKQTKVQENVEAEALGVIAQEASAEVETIEIDATTASPDGIAREVADLLEGGSREPYRHIDWSEVILEWY
ncbi:MAG: dephospho-CoA kinase [Anaerolineae bacterium]|nr:dephospho-CoA kinase [Anaerolineae bacterium]NIN99898.1 dephospho-CoA kinase [Anaerolineae bacterium]